MIDFSISDLLFSVTVFHLCFLLCHCPFKSKVSIFCSFLTPNNWWKFFGKKKKKKLIPTVGNPYRFLLPPLNHASSWGWTVYRGINYREKLEWQSKSSVAWLYLKFLTEASETLPPGMDHCVVIIIGRKRKTGGRQRERRRRNDTGTYWM